MDLGGIDRLLDRVDGSLVPQPMPFRRIEDLYSTSWRSRIFLEVATRRKYRRGSRFFGGKHALFTVWVCRVYVGTTREHENACYCRDQILNPRPDRSPSKPNRITRASPGRP